jgi:hypothetical protein
MQMVKRGIVEEMCSLLLLVAQEEQQKLHQTGAKPMSPSEQPSEVITFFSLASLSVTLGATLQ